MRLLCWRLSQTMFVIRNHKNIFGSEHAFADRQFNTGTGKILRKLLQRLVPQTYPTREPLSLVTLVGFFFCSGTGPRTDYVIWNPLHIQPSLASDQIQHLLSERAAMGKSPPNQYRPHGSRNGPGPRKPHLRKSWSSAREAKALQPARIVVVGTITSNCQTPPKRGKGLHSLPNRRHGRPTTESPSHSSWCPSRGRQKRKKAPPRNLKEPFNQPTKKATGHTFPLLPGVRMSASRLW